MRQVVRGHEDEQKLSERDLRCRMELRGHPRGIRVRRKWWVSRSFAESLLTHRVQPAALMMCLGRSV